MLRLKRTLSFLIIFCTWGWQAAGEDTQSFKPLYESTATRCPEGSELERYIEVPLFHDLQAMAKIENIPGLKTHDELREMFQEHYLQVYYELLKPFDQTQETIIFIPGGPGQTHTFIHEMFGDDTKKTGLNELTKNFNVLVMDHRGVGCSRPIFPGDEPPEGLLMRYAASDIELIRRELMGEEGKLHVWGGSYGTMLAQTYALLYPEQTQSLFLWEGFSSHLDYSKAQRKFESMVAYGVPGIYDRYYQLKEQYPDYTDKFLALAGYEMYDYFGRTRRLKETFEKLEKLLQDQAFSEADQLLSPASPVPAVSIMPWMMRSIACLEIFSWKPLYAGEFNIFGSFFESCKEFEGHEDYFDYTASLTHIQAPTFLFSGLFDHVTPYEAMLEMHSRLPNSYLYLDPHLGHGVQKPKCLGDFMVEFFKGASNKELDEISYSPACRNKPPEPESVEI